MNQIWKQNHALVPPARYEGLPLAIVMALLCGRLAAVIDVAGNTEIIDGGGHGFVAEPPTVEHLYGAMERAWAYRDMWREMCRPARVRIRTLAPRDAGTDLARGLLGLAQLSTADG